MARTGIPHHVPRPGNASISVVLLIVVCGAHAALTQSDQRSSRASSNSSVRGPLWGQRMCRTTRCRWTTSGWH